MADCGEEADEDVVFQNSALYQHLREVGFTEEDVSAAPASRISSLGASENTTSNSIFISSRRKLMGFWSRVSQGCNFSHWWRDQKKAVEKEQCDAVCDLVGKGGILEDEDAAFLHNYLQMTATPVEPELISDKSSISVSVRVACIAVLVIGYAVQTLLYPIHTLAVRSHVWLYDAVVFLIVLLGGFLPLVLIGIKWHLRRSQQRTVQNVDALIKAIQDLRNMCRKCVRLVQEMELVARGFTFVTPLTVVGRFEQNSLQSSRRQAPRLRHAVFHVARNVMMTARDATNFLLQSHSLASEGEGGCGYLAQLPLDEYGPCATLEDGSDLSCATDNYALEALKAMVQLSNIHTSEFMRRLVLGFLLPREDLIKPSGVDDTLKVLQSAIKQQSSCLQQAYQLHRCSVFNQQENASSTATSTLQTSPMYTAVHSLDLHLQAALKKARGLEEQLEKLPALGDVGDWSVPFDLQEQFGLDLEQVRSELDACQDCCEEAANRLEKPNKKQPGPPDDNVPVKKPVEKPAMVPVALFELGDPIIQDQVFEAYTDPNEVEVSDWGYEPILSDEERQKKKKEKQEAVRLLKELKSVIAVKKTEMDAREVKALHRKDEKEGRWQLEGENTPHVEMVPPSNEELEKHSEMSRNEVVKEVPTDSEEVNVGQITMENEEYSEETKPVYGEELEEHKQLHGEHDEQNVHMEVEVITDNVELGKESTCTDDNMEVTLGNTDFSPENEVLHYDEEIVNTGIEEVIPDNEVLSERDLYQGETLCTLDHVEMSDEHTELNIGDSECATEEREVTSGDTKILAGQRGEDMEVETVCTTADKEVTPDNIADLLDHADLTTEAAPICEVGSESVPSSPYEMPYAANLIFLGNENTNIESASSKSDAENEVVQGTDHGKKFGNEELTAEKEPCEPYSSLGNPSALSEINVSNADGESQIVEKNNGDWLLLNYPTESSSSDSQENDFDSCRKDEKMPFDDIKQQTHGNLASTETKRETHSKHYLDTSEESKDDDNIKDDDKEALKEKFARQCGVDMAFSASVAALAAAKSHQIALEEETFGGSSSEDEIVES